MAFDPDAYLAKPTKGFDPDAYLAAGRKVDLTPASYADRVASIPGGAAPTPRKKRSIGDVIGGVAETPIALLSGAVGGVVEPLAGIYGELSSPAKQGSPEATVAGQRAMQAVRRGLFQPQTQTGQDIMGGIGSVTNALLPAVPVMNTIPRAVPNVRDAANYAAAPIRAAAENRQAAKVAKSYENAPVLDATQTAVKHNLIVDPSITNPTAKNRLKGAVVGDDFGTIATTQNAKQVTDLVRKDLGVAPTEKLTQASIEKALDDASQPYEVVKNLPDMVMSDGIRARIESLRKSDVMGSKGSSQLSNRAVDHALSLLEQKTTGTSLLTTKVQGRKGAELLKDIREQRRAAQDTYKSRDAGNDPGQAAIDAADTKYALAKILEDLIDENVKDPAVIENLKAARTRMAQVYEHDRAINYANHTVDPQVYAKLLNERKGQMTGLGADIGQVAAQFPNLMTSVEPSVSRLPRLTRGGLGATIGAGIGLATGVPLGPLVGAAGGAVAGTIGSKAAARRMASPKYQARNALAKDYRPAPGTQLTPAEINYGPNQLVPFDPRNAVTGAAPQGPNFTFGRPGPYVSPDRPTGPPQLGLSSAEEVLNGLAQERARAAAMSRTLGQQAEAAAEAAAKSPDAFNTMVSQLGQQNIGSIRAPRKSSEALVLELDSAGNLVPATPTPTGSIAPTSLQSAIEKLSGQVVPETSTTFKTQRTSKKNSPNLPTYRTVPESQTTTFERGVSQAFNLTATEKIAWNKAKADLAVAAPELKGMSDAQIAGKIMDREWAAEAVKKAREKAQAFDDIAQRAKTTEAKRSAEKSRDELLDALDAMEENMQGPRPTRSGAQGPKTRAAIKNQMAPAPTNRLILD